MQDLSRHVPTAPRSLRAGVSARASANAGLKEHGGAARTQRGRKPASGTVWRRCEMGTNHIACFGVWRRGTRRQVVRSGRPDMTRWHMPHRGDAAVVLPGAVHREVTHPD
jgi:hypothetical protein